MCIITRKSDDIVVSISLIPGLLDNSALKFYNVYFPVADPLPKEGDVWVGDSECLLNIN
jgi:hypothetical protein